MEGHQEMVQSLRNDEKDRHVLAAAVRARADFIITFNLRHFRPKHLEGNVMAIHPDVFLLELLRLEPLIVRRKLEAQAADRNRPLDRLLAQLEKTVPRFAQALRL